MASAFSPSGFGSRWLNLENSISGSELDSLIWATVEPPDKIDPPTPKAMARQAIAKVDKRRIAISKQLILCEERAGCRPVSSVSSRAERGISQSERRSHNLISV